MPSVAHTVAQGGTVVKLGHGHIDLNVVVEQGKPRRFCL